MAKIVQYEEQRLIFPNKYHEYIKEDDGTWRPEEGEDYTPEGAHQNLLRAIEVKKALDDE
jgi:hypothetical protein